MHTKGHRENGSGKSENEINKNLGTPHSFTKSDNNVRGHKKNLKVQLEILGIKKKMKKILLN